jgi:hypothetical protein
VERPSPLEPRGVVGALVPAPAAEWGAGMIGYDVPAGHVVHTATRRGWDAMTSDPGRLRRLEPDIGLTLL